MDTPPEHQKLIFSAIAWVGGALLAVIAWFAQRSVAILDRKQESFEDRIAALEGDRVTKGDMTAVYERVNQLADQSHQQYKDLSDQNMAILRTLVERK